MQIITLTTDFGDKDAYVGIIKGVICNIYPYAKIVDVTHNVPPQDIWHANFIIENIYSFYPHKTIHLCVVDPGVGSKRKPILIETKNYYFIGPNNGSFTSALEKEELINIVELTEQKYWLADHKGQVNPSRTFHGRDIFSPIAANLAKGTKAQDLGTPITKEELVMLPISKFEQNGKSCIGSIKYIDHFGNMITNIPDSIISGNIKGKVKGSSFKGLISSYAESKPNELSAIKSSNGYVELFMYKGNIGTNIEAPIEFIRTIKIK